MAGVRARFVREILQAAQRANSPELVREAFDKLRARLNTLSSFEDLSRLGPADVLWLPDAEELLLALDLALGDGSGKLLEDVSTEHFARIVGSGGLVVPGDLMASVARLRAPLEHFFDTSPMGFDVMKSRQGFTMFLGIGGRPRTARLLRHVATGAVRAMQRFAREGLVEHVKITGETLGDRARIEAWVRTTIEPAVLESPSPASKSSRPPGTRRPAKPHLPTTKPTLEAVERIIQRSVLPAPADPNEIVSTRSPAHAGGFQAPERSSVPGPSKSDMAPRSDTLPSARMPSGFIKKADSEPESGSG